MQDATYKRYLLALLVLISAFNFVDRLTLSLLSQNIKSDLSLTDSELGLLSGIAYSLFYAIMGIPLARWADRGNRVTIIAATAAVWSVAVALCGAARSFVQLVLIRVVVAVGEAGCLPAQSSLIPDHFLRAERPRVNGILGLSGPLSMLIGYGVAGWISQLYGWRATFVALGLPGLFLALLAALTLREPRTALNLSPMRQNNGDPIRPVTLRRTFTTLWCNATFRHLVIALMVGSFFTDGIYQWLPAFFMRSYGLQTGELGTVFAVLTGACGFLGSLAGGDLMSRFAGHSERLQFKVMSAVYAAAMFISAGTYLTGSEYVAFGLMALNTLLQFAVSNSMSSIAQTILPERMRATGFAVLYLFINLIGVGIGPLLGGVLSDLLHPVFGEQSLRYALVALTPGYLWTAGHLWWASRTVQSDIVAAQLQGEEHLPGRIQAVVTPAR